MLVMLNETTAAMHGMAWTRKKDEWTTNGWTLRNEDNVWTLFAPNGKPFEIGKWDEYDALRFSTETIRYYAHIKF